MTHRAAEARWHSSRTASAAAAPTYATTQKLCNAPFAFVRVSSGFPSVLWRCWLGGRKGIWPVKKLSGGVLAWLSDWSIRPSWCHCHSLTLASVKSRLVLPFWYQFTWVVPDKGPLNGCVCVCHRVKKCALLTWNIRTIKHKSVNRW